MTFYTSGLKVTYFPGSARQVVIIPPPGLQSMGKTQEASAIFFPISDGR
jgi:hypothetical protein